jgi:HEAT repeat protein
MDTRNSALIVGLYLLCVIIIAVACFTYYSYERSANPMQTAQVQSLEAPQVGNRTSPVYTAAIAKANKSVRDLQSNLAMSRNLIDQRTTALNQKSAECKALRDQLDHALMLLLNLLDEDTNAASDTGGATEVRAKLETELSRLTQTLGNPEKVEIETADQLLQLQSELIQADLHLAAVEQQSQRELELLNAEKRTVEQTTSEVIARCGPAAVPLLVELLSDERVEIRRWAAKALGAIGPDARDANLLLRELLSDPDPTVRAEVEQALAKMD